MGNHNCHSANSIKVKTQLTENGLATPGSGNSKYRGSSSKNSTSVTPRSNNGSLVVTAATGSQIMMASQKITCSNVNLQKLAKHLTDASSTAAISTTGKGISKITFQTEVFPHSPVASEYLWEFFADYSEKKSIISETQFTDAAEKIYAQITDKEQIKFYLKMFAKGVTSINRNAFGDFLLSAFQLDYYAQMITANTTIGSSSMSCAVGGGSDEVTAISDLNGNEWIQAVIKSCYHLKDDMSNFFVCNWLELNLPRLLITFHKYVTYQLNTGYTLATQVTTSRDLTIPQTPTRTALGDDGVDTSSVILNERIRRRVSVTGINPVLLWLLRASLPSPFSEPLEKKPEPLICPFTTFISPQQLLRQLLNEAEKEEETWTLLYDSGEQGTSINRFQYNLYNYKGPTVLLIFAENNYTFCVGSDEEWKESSRFWGREDSFLVQLQPEFRIVEKGPKMLYTNFSIRGYPFGIHIGKNVKNPTVQIKPDFEYVSFKEIPCRINQILAFGCGSTQVKKSQTEYKKWEDKQCELHRVVKRSKSEWNENPDKYLLELGGVSSSYARGN